MTTGRSPSRWACRAIVLWMILTAVALVVPIALDGQGIEMLTVTPSTSLTSRCRHAEPLLSDPRWIRVRTALAHPGDGTWDPPLAALHDSLEASLANQGTVAERYLLAAVMGARSEVATGRTKLEWAAAMQVQAQTILSEDPSHAGAHHLVGRLHAAVQRLGRVKRFLARHLFGAEVLDGASWDSARRHLEHAKRAAPCLPEHHFELARLYADLGDPRLAREEVEHVFELIGEGPDPSGTRRKAGAVAEHLPDPGLEHTGSDL